MKPSLEILQQRSRERHAEMAQKAAMAATHEKWRQVKEAAERRIKQEAERPVKLKMIPPKPAPVVQKNIKPKPTVDFAKVKKFVKDKPHRGYIDDYSDEPFERPPAIYSNIPTPYGIADELHRQTG